MNGNDRFSLNSGQYLGASLHFRPPGNGKAALLIRPDGRIELGEGCTNAEAAQALVDMANDLMAKHGFAAQPSPGGQGDALAMIGANLRSIAHLATVQAESTNNVTVANIHTEARHALQLLDSALAARQPVGELHLPPDGFYKIVFDDAEVPDESFARSGALDAALRRFEQISNKWNAHLFVRFANNTRDCTVPNATPAQAVDLDKLRLLGERIEQVGKNAAPTAQGSGNVYFRNVIDWGRELQSLVGEVSNG